MLSKILTATLVLLLGSLVYFFTAGPPVSAENQAEDYGINGVVRSNKGLPLENVQVGIRGAEDLVVTDSQGHFFIPFKNANQRLFQWDITAAKKGYLNNDARYAPGSGDLNITLQAIPDFKAPDYLETNKDKNSGFNGFVTDTYGKPLDKARVRIMGNEEFVATDAEGRFTVPLKNQGQKLFQWIVTAGKEGYLNGAARYMPGTDVLPITLRPVPVHDSTDYQMVITSPAGPFPNDRGVKLPRDCGNCHTTVLWEWGLSKMGKTTQNNHVLNAYQQFVREKRVDQQNTCADCHAPIAALQAPGQTDYERAVTENYNLSKGIECDFCHKIRDVEVSNNPGVQAIKMNRLDAGGWFFEYGPYDDVVAMPMAASFNSLYKKSEYCSSCHQDGIGLPEGKSWDYTAVYPEAEKFSLYEKGKVIPDQWTYQEWLEWQESLPETDKDKGVQCQNCHMNWTKEMLPYYRFVVSGDVKNYASERNPDTIFPHKFEGASPKRLEGSAHLTLASNPDGDELEVSVGITNVNAGHRLPTGQHTRNMILLVTAEDENGNQLAFIDGPVVPDWGGTGQNEGDYGGRPGKGYARVTADDDGNFNVPIWRATRIASDNRLKAKETDESNYRFKLPPGVGEDVPIYVTAKLIYRKDFRDGKQASAGVGEDIIMQEKTIESGNGGL
jgi:Cytochrome c554 and c-prime